MAWAGNSIYAIPNGRRKKKRSPKATKKRHPSRRYCPECGRRTGSKQNPKVCSVHGKMGVPRRPAKGPPRARGTRRERKEFYGPNYLWHEQHETHLRSARWTRSRLQIITRDHDRCQTCQGRGRDVHHIHYRTMGHEKGDELVLLCRTCHQKEHQQFRLSQREDHWREVILSRNRTRGAVCLERHGSSPSTTPGAQVEAPGHHGKPREKTCTASQPASMAVSRGEHSEKAMPHHAQGERESDPGDAGLLDAACHQSPARVAIRRRGRSGLATETRTG